jgi:hypothetical protein
MTAVTGPGAGSRSSVIGAAFLLMLDLERDQYAAGRRLDQEHDLAGPADRTDEVERVDQRVIVHW